MTAPAGRPLDVSTRTEVDHVRAAREQIDWAKTRLRALPNGKARSPH